MIEIPILHGEFPHKLLDIELGYIKVLRPENLNNKVFGTDAVPFNIYTHAVLGDGVDIKPSITPGIKKKLVEVATHEHWNIHTPQWTKDRLNDIGVRIPFQITSK